MEFFFLEKGTFLPQPKSLKIVDEAKRRGSRAKKEAEMVPHHYDESQFAKSHLVKSHLAKVIWSKVI